MVCITLLKVSQNYKNVCIIKYFIHFNICTLHVDIGYIEQVEKKS